jgi:peptidoglycan/LPS O-acetylase OafA/YrhL
MNTANDRFRSIISRQHLPALDGLRAVAALTVVAAHAEGSRIPGDLGVSAFFVLSGFLITRLLLREVENSGTVSKRQFYIRRTLRIFPAYYAFIVVSFLLDARAGQQWSLARSLTALTYSANYFNAFNHHATTSTAHVWSLAVEEQFYLLWPVLFVFLVARGRRALLTGLGALGLAALAWRSWLILGVHVDASYVYNAFDTRMDNLAVGCLLAVIADYDRVSVVAEAIARRFWFPLLTLGMLLVSRLAFTPSYHYTVGFLVDAVLVGVLIVQLLQLYSTAVWSWMESPVVTYLGRISYPIYLYHGWGGSFGRLVPEWHGTQFIFGVLATIGLASGSYFVIEKPFLNLKKRYSSARTQKAVPIVTASPAPAAGMLALTES